MGAAPRSYPIRSGQPLKFKEWVLSGSLMHLRQKIAIGMCFITMPAVAPLWALMLNLEVASMIRIMTIIFVPSLIMALGVKSPQSEEE